MKKVSVDDIMVFLVISFIILPIIIFLGGWTKPIIFIIGTLILIRLGIIIFKEVKKNITISISNQIKFWIFSFFIIGIWCLFSGVGGFSYQTGDFIVRNPIFNDLCTHQWPVRIDMSGQTMNVKALYQDTKYCNLVYYFTWWLPVAALVKLLGLNGLIANILLWVYMVLEVFVIFYCVSNILKRYSYLALASLILFGGFDFLIYFIENFSFAKGAHIEWWAGYFEYSANTTQVYWIFNASLPIWLITSVLFLLQSNKYKAAWGALAFPYNPFATITMILLVLAAEVNSNKTRPLKKRIQEMISVENIIVPLAMFIVFSSFYLQINLSKTSVDGWIFRVYPEKRLLSVYVLFNLIEFGVYFIAMGWEARKTRFYWIVLIGLSIVPIYKMGKFNDFSLKAPIPLLFMLMLIVLQRYYNENKKRRIYILVTLLIGFLTSATEIQRNVTNTLVLAEKSYIQNVITSFDYVNSGNKDFDIFCCQQYLAPLDNNIWNKYISK